MTGKTRYLARQAANAVEARGPGSVTIVSLTKAAAIEIAGRVQVQADQVGTLHSLCMHAGGLAGRPVLDSGRGFKLWNEWVKAKHPTLQLSGGSDPDDPMAGSKDATQGTRNLERLILLRHQLIPPDLWPKEVQEFGYLWSDCLKELEAIDFTDMIEAGLEIDPPGSPTVLLADEVQDFSALEGAVVRRWATMVETCALAGDEDQTLYAWRGADPRVFSGHPVPDGNRKVLPQSYRVPVAVHALARRIIQQVRTRTDNVYLPTPEPGRVTYREDASWRKPEGWVDDMLRDSENGGAMVLASCAYLLQPLLAFLRDEGIPFHNPYRRKRGDWNPLGSQDTERKTAANQLLAYLEGGPGMAWSTDELKCWIPLLRTVKHKVPLLDDKGILAYGAKAALQRLSSAFPTNDEYLGLFSEPESTGGALAREIEWLVSGVSQENRDRLAYPLAVHRKGGAELLRAEPKVSVGTIHSVKGAENRNVYVITAIPGTFADGDQDALARLFYVAVTRARESVTLICGGREAKFQV